MKAENGPVPYQGAGAHKKDDIVISFVCNICARNHGLTPAPIAESGKSSWICSVCSHHNIGSRMICMIGEWLKVVPLYTLSSDSEGVSDEKDSMPNRVA